MFLFISILFCYDVFDPPSNCHDYNGASVFRVYVQLDKGSLLSFAKSFIAPTLKGAMKFFGPVFDDINKEIMSYGIQLHADYSKFLTEYPYDKEKCSENFPTYVRGVIMQSIELMANINGYGTRMMVFFCPDKTDASMHGTVRTGCNTIIGFLFGDLDTLKTTIKEHLVGAIFNTESKGDTLNSAICEKAFKCISQDESVFGRYIPDLKAVRHISNEEYILEDGDKVNEHDLYDDTYIKRYAGK